MRWPLVRRALVLAASLASATPLAAQDEPLGRVTPAEVAAAVALLQEQLPMAIDEVTRAEAIRAEGTEFVYDMVILDTVPDGSVEAARISLQAANQQRMCENTDIALFYRRGGSMRHIYTDQAGHRFETRVTHCPD